VFFTDESWISIVCSGCLNLVSGISHAVTKKVLQCIMVGNACRSVNSKAMITHPSRARLFRYQ
jgi:hypothetical protein